MANQFVGVVPCYEGLLSVGATEADATLPKDIESIGVSIDNGVEEWNPYDTKGWMRRLMTAKSVTFSLNGKRNIGDTGNDFIAGKAFKNGKEAEGYVALTFPDGTKISWANAVYSVTELLADATNGCPLGCDVMSNGAPTITPAT